MRRWIRNVVEWLYVWHHIVQVYVLPRRLAHRLGRWWGSLGYRFSRRTRSVAVENLQLFLGMDEEAAHRTALESCKQAGAALADLARAGRVNRMLVRRDVEVPDATWRAIDAIRRGKRGAVLATSHYGNWEFHCLAGPFSALPPTTVIIRPIRNPLLNKLLYNLRSRTGQKLLHRDGAALESMQRVRDGEIVAVTVDLAIPPDAGGAPVEFFGVPTYTTLAVGYIAAMTKAPAYLSYFLPIGGCRYRFVLKGPLESQPLETLKETALATTRNVSRALEETIREYPAAWAWWTKRWRIRPPGTAGRYPTYARPLDQTRRKRDAFADVGAW